MNQSVSFSDVVVLRIIEEMVGPKPVKANKLIQNAIFINIFW